VAKKAAEKKFIDIAAAKEVLTDPGMCPRSVINKFITQTLPWVLTRVYI